MRSSLRFCALAALLLSATGCGGNSNAPSPPSAAPLTGPWSGTFTQAFFGAGPTQMTLTQTQNSVTGSVRVTFQAFPQDFATFTVSGTVNGNSVNVTLATTSQNTLPPGVVTCPGAGTLTLTTSTPLKLHGDIAATSGGCATATADLTKQ